MPDLSIIIVTYNPGPILDACLQSLPAASNGVDTEIIVVDNESSDGTPDKLHSVYPHINLIVNSDNRGFAAANNQGLHAATGDYLLLLNPDVIAHPDSFSLMINYLRNQPDVGITGPRTYDQNGKISLTAHLPFSTTQILWQYLGLDRLFPYRVYGFYRYQCEHASQPFDVGWVQAHCLMMTRQAYKVIGEMDESVFLFTEDPDICERAITNGLRIVYMPDACVIHHESTSVSRYPLVRIRHYHISPLYYFRKRKQFTAIRWLKIGFTFEIIMKLCIHLLRMKWIQEPAERTRLEAYSIVLKEIWAY